MERQFSERGLERAAKREEAGIVVLNTCTVTAAADQDARAAIRRIYRENPECQILVSGCYAQRAPPGGMVPFRSQECRAGRLECMLPPPWAASVPPVPANPQPEARAPHGPVLPPAAQWQSEHPPPRLPLRAPRARLSTGAVPASRRWSSPRLNQELNQGSRIASPIPCSAPETMYIRIERVPM